MTDFERGMREMLRRVCRALAEYRESDEELAAILQDLERGIAEEK